jgi:hypothetical protein
MSEHALISWLKQNGFGKYLSVNPSVQYWRTDREHYYSLHFDVPKDDGVTVVEKLHKFKPQIYEILLTLVCKQLKIDRHTKRWAFDHPFLATADQNSSITIDTTGQEQFIGLAGPSDFWLFEELHFYLQEL